jgi:hypothetical protein
LPRLRDTIQGILGQGFEVDFQPFPEATLLFQPAPRRPLGSGLSQAADARSYDQ